ncbi:MAG: peptidylprolyl isomerase [Candidatus Eremiobacteraeota bacterium]|nr:peptidylprolyl isomerase [Candidatus Eremiobacteraeota bacterium]
MMRRAHRAGAVFVTMCMAALLAACSGGGNVATINGQAITKSDLDSKLESGPAAKATLNQIAQSMLIEQYAKDHNINVSDADIDKKINQLKAQYGATQFDNLIKQRGMTEDDVRRAIRDQLIVDQALGKNIRISDADVKKFFDKNHAAFDKPPQVHARHILVSNLQTANMVEQKLKSGAKFEDLAKQYSQDPGSKDKGGDLGFFRTGQMMPTFEKAAFSQKINEVGPPVKSPFGYHIIEVLERTPAQKATLASAHDQIVDQLRSQQEAPLVQPFLQQLLSNAKIDVKDQRFADAFPSPAPSGAPAAAPSR